MSAQTHAPSQTESPDTQMADDSPSSHFRRLVRKEFRPRNDKAASQVDKAIQLLAAEALRDTTLIGEDVEETIQVIIGRLDRILAEQIDDILHHPDFQALERAWRGLQYLVDNTATSSLQKIKVLNISKSEIQAVLKNSKAEDKWDRSILFTHIYDEGIGSHNGDPFACLIGDYQFDHQQQDVDTLKRLGRIAAAAHAPFIAAAAPALCDIDVWRDYPTVSNLDRLFDGVEYAAWRELRDSDDARYLSLCMPRFLVRAPYKPGANEAEGYVSFRETVDNDAPEHLCWANSAYAMGVNINRAFTEYGWVSRIRGVEAGGQVTGLPQHLFTAADGQIDATCPTEIALPVRKETALSAQGLTALVHERNATQATFFDAPNLRRPVVYEGAPDKTAEERLGTRLPYIFTTSRFAHYLVRIVYRKIGSDQFSTADEVQRWLNQWIKNYVLGDPRSAGEKLRAEKPLADATVEVEADPERPGYYRTIFNLRPHFQIEEMNVSMRLTSLVPSKPR